jgi:hypothetical protein
VGAGADCRSDLAAKAISLGLNDEEMAALVGITPPTLFEWKKDPEFFEAIKSAVSARLLIFRRSGSGPITPQTTLGERGPCHTSGYGLM